MTIKQAIDRADALKPNSYAHADKVKWVKDVERRVYNEIYINHEPGDKEFVPPTDEDDDSYELFAPSPYDELYVLYLSAQIDAANSEYGRYNNTARQFESVYGDLERFWQAGHMPIPLNLIRF